MPQKDFLAAQLENAASEAQQNGRAVFMDFFEPAVRKLIEREIGRYPACDCAFWGGSEFSERAVAAVFEKGAPPEYDDYPVECLHIKGADASVEHRDVLGSLIGLGLERDRLGDINIADGLIQFFVKKPLAEFIEQNLTQISHFDVKAEAVPASEIVPFDPQFTFTDAIVPSLRLDAVINTVFRMSRSEASAFVKAGKVFINHVPAAKPAASVKTGDLISVRSKGRFIIDGENGATKKGNLKIRIKRFS